MRWWARLTCSRGHPPGVNLAMAYSARALLAVNRGWDLEALEFGHRALAIAREVGDHATESHALCNIGAALLGKNDRTGYESLEQSLALALEHALEDEAARTYRTLLFYSVLIHDFARADPLFREGVAHCEERGILSHGAYMRAYFAPCESSIEAAGRRLPAWPRKCCAAQTYPGFSSASRRWLRLALVRCAPRRSWLGTVARSSSCACSTDL